VSKHPGFNVAYWNLHERHVEFRDDEWRVNGKWPLVFFHFSNLAIQDGEAITKVPTRITLREQPALRPLFDEYRAKLLAYHVWDYKKFSCAYIDRRKQWLQEQQRLYYRKYPVRFVAAQLKRLVPKGLKSYLRGSNFALLEKS
jgi:hypothetical protein